MSPHLLSAKQKPSPIARLVLDKDKNLNFFIPSTTQATAVAAGTRPATTLITESSGTRPGTGTSQAAIKAAGAAEEDAARSPLFGGQRPIPCSLKLSDLLDISSFFNLVIFY